MRLLLKSVKIIDPASPHHNQLKDLLIENGMIRKIATSGTLQEKADKVIEQTNLHVSTGWFDLRANFCEPGHEYKEDLKTGCMAAALGGYTGVLLMPSTKPSIQSKSDVEFIKAKSADNIVQVIASGSLSVQRNGVDLSEMYDMWLAGARVFTDDKRSVQDSGLMLRALLYSKNFGGLIMSYGEDINLTSKGQMNEGKSNVNLGMKGMPSLAEEVMTNRDLSLAEYAEAPVHITLVSSIRSVDLIRQAKKKGIKVTADVAVHNLVLDDSSLEGFDTNYKLKPPLRAKTDIQALIEGVKDGTIDCICTDHAPEDIESKKKEFELANFGIIGLQSAFGLMNKVLQRHLPLEKIIALITSNPRKILGLELPSINEGEPANLTLFDPDKEWVLTESMLASKSKNTPFINEQLLGKAVAVINNGKIIECN